MDSEPANAEPDAEPDAEPVSGDRSRKVDRDGNEVEDRIYNQHDCDRLFVIDNRTELVAGARVR